MGMMTIQEHFMSVWKTDESDLATTSPARRETEDETKEECLAAIVVLMTEGKPMVSLQVNCSIYNKTFNFWNFTHVGWL
jgi:hypothetical protein